MSKGNQKAREMLRCCEANPAIRLPSTIFNCSCTDVKWFPWNRKTIDCLLVKHHRMPWPFCPSCRATLTVDRTGAIECNVCPYRSNLSELDHLPESTTYSADRPTPLWAKSDEEQAALRKSSEPVRATIEEPCVKCGHPEVGYYTVQLRSVDEGQTVFYECPKCKHNWSVNN